ncbi:MAG: IS607 family transposase [Thiomargarita sp.]|nr:IS607 family transposase [Thiomargarita sp.]
MMKEKKLYTVNQYAKLKGISPQTVRAWSNEGKIEVERTQGGHRRIVIYDDPIEVQICYCRVSSYQQKIDLERQVQLMKEKYPNAEIIKDIGSGLNFKRKGLKTLLERAMSGTKLTVILAHRDRFGRFAFDLLQWIIERSGGCVVVLDKTEHSPEQELTKDLLSILHVFSCRLHGLRSYRDQVNQALSKSGAEKNTPILD